jgi:peptide-methionine (R)-S-oxide reductase
MNRRTLLFGSAAVIGLGSTGAYWLRIGRALDASEQVGDQLKDFGDAHEIELSEAEWRGLLTENQFLVLREEQTETPYTSSLNDETREGTYHCAGCNLPVYSSQTKYDSGTGWPSFWAAIDDAVRTKPDNTLFIPRIEVHCRRCKGHLGHIFDDGPDPTGERHCLNGLALSFAAVGVDAA